MSDRTLNWGESASAARYQTQDDDPEGGNFVFVRDLDNETIPLQYLFTTEELLAGVGIDLDGNDLANVGDVAATTASVSTAPSEATDVARNEDLSEIQESADVDHDATTNRTHSGDSLEPTSVDTEDFAFQSTDESTPEVDPATGTVSMDHSASNWYDPIAATEDITVEFANETGTGLQFTLRFTDGDDGGPYTITWPDSVVWSGGDVVDEIPEGADVEVFLLSPDGGTTWRAREGGREFS